MNKVRYLKYSSIFILLLYSSAYADYTYIVRKGDTLSEIVFLFSGSLNYYPVAERNKIANPDLIHPNDKIILSPDKPINRLRSYLKNIYDSQYKSAYLHLSSQTRERFTYEGFVKNTQPEVDYDLFSISICADFYYKKEHYCQLSIFHYEDPAKWGFDLVRKKYQWFVVLNDLNPTHPAVDESLGCRCE